MSVSLLPTAQRVPTLSPGRPCRCEERRRERAAVHRLGAGRGTRVQRGRLQHHELHRGRAHQDRV